ncbi:undecaprenyl-diphosphate phosphatase, partial [bacterium]|nr:undecaprenyl-diphosphate phosphatase [bacterium]
VSIMLGVNAIILFAGHFYSLKQRNIPIDMKRALFIGLAQGISVIPGISRSGATISASLISGVSREQAFSYSFILAIPTLIAAFLFQFLKTGNGWNGLGIMPLITGFFTSFVVGFFALTILKRLLLNSKWYYFGIYCLVISVSIILFTLKIF